MIERKSTIKKLIVLGALIVVFAVLTLLSNNRAVCEFFATTFARAWIFVFGHISSILPISFYELFLIAAIVLAVVFVVLLIKFLAKRKWSKLLSMVLIAAITVMSFLSIYTATATMTYNRNELPEDIYKSYSGDDLTYEQALELAQIMVDGLNETYAQTDHDANGNIVIPYTVKQLSELIDDAYGKIDGNYLSSYTPSGKKIINKTIMSEMHIVGVFFAPFGEANVNGYENNLYLPQTLAHEIAHSKGVMREFQADIVSCYALLQSDDPYLRYSAYAKCYSYALQIVSLYPNSQADYARLANEVNDGVFIEKSNYGKFYAQFDHLDNLGKFFNDLYLKLQKQPEGTGSYVKPGEIVGTGQVDDDGEQIVYVVHFSGLQNMLIGLYKQDKLK